jgi:hypothetical protein
MGQGADYEGEIVRHLYGTALAVVMTAVMFFAGAWGYLQLLHLPVPPGQANALPAGGGSLLSNSTVLLALAALVATAVLAGVLAAVPWFSPLASGLPGLLLLAWTALYLVSVRRAVEFIPLRSHAFGAGWESLLFNGVLGAAGAVLVFPMFIPSRWRAPHVADVADVSGPGVPAREADDYPTAARTDIRTRQPGEDPALVGTVMPGSVKRVDTTRITGASRALRNTGSFRVATGTTPRTTGSFRGASDTTLLGRPYLPAEDRPYPPPGR